MRERLFCMPFSQPGFCTKLFGLHSFRSRSTIAVAGTGVNEGLLKRHGRCPSDKTKHDYVRDNLVALKSVS